jgi:alpha-glucoside transport system substrate-binding protein
VTGRVVVAPVASTRTFGHLGRSRRFGSGHGLVVALITLLGLAACAPGQSTGGGGGNGKVGGTVHVLATWTGSEQDSFMAVLKPFEDRTGITVEYEATRDLDATLLTRLSAGNPPELTGAPSTGTLNKLAGQGKVVALDNIVDMNTLKSQYADTWIKLGQVNGKLYQVFSWAAMKGLVWYDPKSFQAKGYQVPKTWSDFTTLLSKVKSDGTTPLCLTMESGAASGWPGSDWVKEIVLAQSGQKVYDNWWAGKQKWSSPEIKQAWQTFGQVLGAGGANIYGGPKYAVATNFGDVGTPMFASPPKCYMLNQGSFITDFFVKANPNLKPSDDFTFFTLPAINTAYDGSTVMAGDAFSMLKSTAQSRELIKYLTTAEAQSIWVKRGGKISPNKTVAVADYPDAISKKVAESLGAAKIADFDAGDLMPSDMRNAYWTGVLDFVQDQSKLDSILANLDKVQASAYTS